MLKLPAGIEKFESRADNTWKLTVGTQELAAEDVGQLAMLKGKVGWFVFASDEENIREDDIPKEHVEFEGDKTPGQRLRGVLYRIWEQGGKKGDFETFYKGRMERIIDQLKEKLT